MEQYKLVLPEHLNHYGYLFGGNMLKWVDEYAWIAASLEHPGCKFVTIGMDGVEFRKGVSKGTILRFVIEKAEQGSTSIRYTVKVFADDIETGREENVFSTHVTFVCLGDNGKKIRIPCD
ncbi:acyl-CoA thioesterase [Thiohalomonas denitrificans]|uniref:acyl-CoA thioesterase n=1 Tax=Thiohalomonas denitrificans TaxID=415747 RepID=UPI0026F1A681|nr:hotdog domain-containing protein [Thiohalomonas denitrificans]